MRAIVLSTGLLAFGLVVALSLPTMRPGTAPPAAVQPEPTLTSDNAAELCTRLFEEPKEYIDDDAKRRRWDLRRESCKMAFDADPANTELKVAVARTLPVAQKVEAIAMLREAAAQGNAEAYLQLYEHHRSWDRGDLDKVPLVTRTEAAKALHKAAELGHPFATQMLVRRLEDGDIVKRDTVAARYWAERAVANPNPSRYASKGDLLVTLGRLLATSDKSEERARGLDILERLSAPGHYQYGARTELAQAIRKEDPVRARTLLEESRRPDPGGAIVPLAEMLIAGEGGWVPRDIQEAVRLIDISSGYDFDARLQVLRLLAENPEVRVSYPKRVLYDAVQAAELDEPGAMNALIELKLSANTQFQDRPGACKLIETAVNRGDQTMTQRLSDCRAN
jgi:TPR repeat protein